MAWIEVHENLREHPKVFALSGYLNQPVYACVGLVTSLWLWALTNAPQGDLSPFPPRAVAGACGWKRSPKLLMEGLKAAGFLNEDGTIHDWMDYAGRLLTQRAAHRARNRLRADCAQPARLPNLTVPNPTEPNRTGMNESCATPTNAAGGGRPLRPLSARDRAMRQIHVSEMEHLAGEEDAQIFSALLEEHDYTAEQVTLALEYTGRKVQRGEVQEPLRYVHQLLLHWDEMGLRDEEAILTLLRGE